MSEQQPQVLSPEAHQAFLQELHPGVVSDMGAIEGEIVEDRRQLRYAQQWLRAYRHDPIADPNHKLYYKSMVDRITEKNRAKLEHPYGEA
jgi:hypothetical protein